MKSYLNIRVTVPGAETRARLDRYLASVEVTLAPEPHNSVNRNAAAVMLRRPGRYLARNGNAVHGSAALAGTVSSSAWAVSIWGMYEQQVQDNRAGREPSQRFPSRTHPSKGGGSTWL